MKDIADKKDKEKKAEEITQLLQVEIDQIDIENKKIIEISMNREFDENDHKSKNDSDD